MCNELVILWPLKWTLVHPERAKTAARWSRHITTEAGQVGMQSACENIAMIN